ncbi:restriction endonuclease subunit S [Corynebacterium variabile]|uniref:restriction endonuclease subunit S n=1 Tax=Corynebacterium variabile TaxID=1727 RepID=UPI003BB5F93D
MELLDSLTFQPMLITDIFIPHKGKRLIAAHRQDGSTPFVGGSESNNSITGFSDVEPLFPGGWLTLVYNGSVGHTRFQPAPFFASDDVIALEPREAGLSAPELLMCAAIIQRECINKYSYGSKLNLQRLGRQTILVPVTSSDCSGQVDWDGLNRLGVHLLSETIDQAQRAIQMDGLP